MSIPSHLRGVFAAALTPLKSDYSIDLDAVPPYLDFLASGGCNGVLLMGTTGEGPSFPASSRLDLLRQAQHVREQHPDFNLLLGTGTPSLEETIALTKAAFDNGADGVVVLPPYYFRNAPQEGLESWFKNVLRQAVPDGGCFLAYHIPGVSGVPISLELLSRLKDEFPRRFMGLKDSSGDPEHARSLAERFGSDLLVFTGNDRLFSLALSHHAAGGITALANLYAPVLKQIWDSYSNGSADAQAQSSLDRARKIMDSYGPLPPILKALLARRYPFPLWATCPPLMSSSSEAVERAYQELFAGE